MQCVTPMFRRYEKANPKKAQIVPRSEVLDGLNYDPNHIRFCLDKVNYMNPKYKYQAIPCQHCWACQLNYSAEWATRCMLEASQYECNWWVTLTYNDEHLPIAEKITIDNIELENPENGSWDSGTLYPDHVSKFFEKMRNYFKYRGHNGVRYFYCGEYGEKTLRPHYHIILFNCPLDPKYFYNPYVDKTFFKAHWKSTQLEKWWSDENGNPMGMIDISELEWNNAAYTARYCMKKIEQEGSKILKAYNYAEIGKEFEFIRMSNRPGIGKKFFDENWQHIYDTDELITHTLKGIMHVKPPKAFDRQLEKINPELLQMIKKSRKECAERNRKYLNKLNDQTDLQRLEIQNERIKTKSQLLPREAF